MRKIKHSDWLIAAIIMIVGLGIPYAVTADVFNGKDGDHVGTNGVPVHIGKTGSKVGFYGASPTVKPILTTVSAATIEAALAAQGLMATATPSATSTPTATATATATATPTP